LSANVSPMKKLDEYYDDNGRFQWPTEPGEAVEVARAILIAEYVAHSRYWADYGRDLVVNPTPEQKFERPWSARAKEDKTFRDLFSSLTEEQKGTVVDLLERCVSGAVFSCLVTLDQFPHGDVDILVRPAVEGDPVPSIKLAPTDTDLHDEFN